MNPATKVLDEIKEKMKLQNRTKKALGPESKEDHDVYLGVNE